MKVSDLDWVGEHGGYKVYKQGELPIMPAGAKYGVGIFLQPAYAPLEKRFAIEGTDYPEIIFWTDNSGRIVMGLNYSHNFDLVRAWINGFNGMMDDLLEHDTKDIYLGLNGLYYIIKKTLGGEDKDKIKIRLRDIELFEVGDLPDLQ